MNNINFVILPKYALAEEDAWWTHQGKNGELKVRVLPFPILGWQVKKEAIGCISGVAAMKSEDCEKRILRPKEA